MKKLQEREPEAQVPPLAKAPALAVQFFLIPLAVVGAIATRAWSGNRAHLGHRFGS